MGTIKNTFAAWCHQNKKEKLLELYDEQANTRSAEEIPFSSAEKLKWRCPVCGIPWSGSTNKMNQQVSKPYNVIEKRPEETYCPYCKGERPSLYYNLVTEKPWVKIFWDPNRNKEDASKLETYLPGTHKKFYFRCPDCLYQLPRRIRPSDIADELLCPNCGNGRPREVTSENSLRALYPKIAEELVDSLNGGITGDTILPSYQTGKLWFQCPNRHLYNAWVYNRVCRGDGCPECGRRKKTSFMEQAISFYIQKCSLDVRNNCLDSHKCSVDILLPKLKIAVEFDSLYYHYNARRLTKENALAKARDKYLKLSQYYRVYVLTEWENELRMLQDLKSPLIIPIKVPVYKSYSKKFFSAFDQKIYELLRLIFPEKENYPNINIQRDELKILAQYIRDPIEDSFQKQYPELAKDWDQRRNGSLTPSMFLPNTPYRFYWICRKCNRTYQTSMPNRRKINPNTCPLCCNKSRYPSSMLHECYPQLAPFWNETLNEYSFKEMTVASEKYGIFNISEDRILPIRICNLSRWLWEHPDKNPEDYFKLQIRNQSDG